MVGVSRPARTTSSLLNKFFFFFPQPLLASPHGSEVDGVLAHSLRSTTARLPLGEIHHVGCRRLEHRRMVQKGVNHTNVFRSSWGGCRGFLQDDPMAGSSAAKPALTLLSTQCVTGTPWIFNVGTGSRQRTEYSRPYEGRRVAVSGGQGVRRAEHSCHLHVT